MNFTPQQVTVMESARDGKTVAPEYLPVIRELNRAGLITSRKVNVNNYPATPGGMVWHKWQTTTRVGYSVYLTEDGRTEMGVLF